MSIAAKYGQTKRSTYFLFRSGNDEVGTCAFGDHQYFDKEHMENMEVSDEDPGLGNGFSQAIHVLFNPSSSTN